MNEHDTIVSISKDYIAIGWAKQGCITDIRRFWRFDG